MKILIISSLDIHGGAARAAYRLHKALLDQNIDSQMLVQSKSTDDYTVIGPSSKKDLWIGKLRPLIDSLPVKRYKNKNLFSPSWLSSKNIVRKINEINPDIVHMHWICFGLLSIKELLKIKAPIIWNCQDMWPFTGGCHYDEYCGGYKKSCGNCKVLYSNKENDLSKKVFNRKLKTYSKIKNLTIVGVSNWVSQCAKESTLFRDAEVITLPNCFDTQLFKPIDKNIVRGMFHIPANKKIILFGAMNVNDQRKGAKELYRAIDLIHVENAVFVIAGKSKPQNPQQLKYPVYYIPPINDEISLPLMYNIADVVIVPSLQENLSNMIIESLSCGIPVIGFDIGGNSDMIVHKETGYLVKDISPEDMAKGIEWVLADENYPQLSLKAREKALAEFDKNIVSKKYIALYQKILGKQQ
jgi:glycosyltransferase involved in cell wall biosynthesis